MLILDETDPSGNTGMMHSHGMCIVMSQFNSYLTYRQVLLFLKWNGIVFVDATVFIKINRENLTPTTQV